MILQKRTALKFMAPCLPSSGNLPGDSSPQFSQNREPHHHLGQVPAPFAMPGFLRLVPGAIGREPEIAHQVGYFGIPPLRFLVVSES